jgi:hypothetical protein
MQGNGNLQDAIPFIGSDNFSKMWAILGIGIAASEHATPDFPRIMQITACI